jgi:hypothetical protein
VVPLQVTVTFDPVAGEHAARTSPQHGRTDRHQRRGDQHCADATQQRFPTGATMMQRRNAQSLTHTCLRHSAIKQPAKANLSSG